MAKVKNSNLTEAKNAKKDEFYTQYEDIQNELTHYKKHFKDKTVLCNCDDPKVSQFFKYFANNFHDLGLKKLICTCYKNASGVEFHYEQECQNIEAKNKGKLKGLETSKPEKPDTSGEKSCYFEYYGKDNAGEKLQENRKIDAYIATQIPTQELKHDTGGGYPAGDFRSSQCKELLAQADIVVTNPPFSLFREYVAQLIGYDKKFLIIGNKNAVTYKEIFKLIKDKKVWLGCTSANEFLKPNENQAGFIVTKQVNGLTRWFTNLTHKKRNEPLETKASFAKEPEKYPKYDNYNAINVDRTDEIPLDYDGVMGVPITFLDKHNPKQFEILGLDRYIEDNPNYGKRFSIKNKETYARILIRKIAEVEELEKEEREKRKVHYEPTCRRGNPKNYQDCFSLKASQ